MSKILGLHGIITNGRGFGEIGGLLSMIPYPTIQPAYRIFPFMGYFKLYREFYITKALEDFNDGDHIVAHSAGCMIAYWVLQRLKEQGRRAGKIFFMNAALDRDIEFPEGSYDHIYNFSEDSDIVLRLSQLLPLHPFGEMGRLGYKGTSSNITNMKDVAEYKYSFLFHGSYLINPGSNVIVKYIMNRIQE